MKAKGFTLPELMICVAIVIIIASIVVPLLNGQPAKPRYNTGSVVTDRPASDVKCDGGIVTRNGVAVKSNNGTFIRCG